MEGRGTCGGSVFVPHSEQTGTAGRRARSRPLRVENVNVLTFSAEATARMSSSMWNASDEMGRPAFPASRVSVRLVPITGFFSRRCTWVAHRNPAQLDIQRSWRSTL